MWLLTGIFSSFRVSMPVMLLAWAHDRKKTGLTWL
jgi:hypothetical protein